VNLSRTLSFSLSVLSLAFAVAWAAPSGPDSPRARFGHWLRAHGHPEIAVIVEPDVTKLPGMGDGQLPTLP